MSPSRLAEVRLAQGGLRVLLHHAGTPGILGLTPARRQADAVVFLASDRSSFMTGTEIYVDGGSAQF